MSRSVDLNRGALYRGPTHMARLTHIVAIVLLLALQSFAWAQGVDRSEFDQWLKDSAHQGSDIPVGTKITMSNWQQYKQFMPFGLVAFFQGRLGWKMPADVEMDIGPSHEVGNLPKEFMDATEKYSSQTSVETLPDGHYVLRNYQGGIPFPKPEEPHKGWKILANVFFSYGPAIINQNPSNYGTVWAQDRFGNIAPSSFAYVYRYSDYIAEQGFPPSYNYAPGTWYTQWAMQLAPEQSRYTASLSLYFKDQESNPFPDTFVFVPALRRSMRLSAASRCSPVFGLDWTYDDAKWSGFNGSTSVYTADYLGDRRILNLTVWDATQGGRFPEGWDMPLAFPKPSWGQWELRSSAIADVHRIPSEAAGYCYSSRMMYVERAMWFADWLDNYDTNRKLWKVFWYGNRIGDVPNLGRHMEWKDIPEAVAWDVQNTHETVWSAHGHPDWQHGGMLIDQNVPPEYMNGVKYGSPGGLMQIMQ